MFIPAANGASFVPKKLRFSVSRVNVRVRPLGRGLRFRTRVRASVGVKVSCQLKRNGH